MLKLSFYGGAQEVTGANYLLESDPSTSSGQATKLLVDCGLFQGSKIAEDKNRAPFDYDPKSINALFVTHSHIDHIGRIPKLVKEGFGGIIYSTPPTKDLAEIMLIDSLGVLEKEAQRDNKEVFYNQEDVRQAMSQWQAIDYHQEFEVQDFKVNFKNAGHILGSAMIEIIYGGATSVGGSRTSVPIKIVFTGDLGNPPAPLLRPPEEVNDADFLIIESTVTDNTNAPNVMLTDDESAVVKDSIKTSSSSLSNGTELPRKIETINLSTKNIEKPKYETLPGGINILSRLEAFLKSIPETVFLPYRVWRYFMTDRAYGKLREKDEGKSVTDWFYLANETPWAKQIGLSNVNAIKQKFQDTAPIVAVLDTGLDYMHYAVHDAVWKNPRPTLSNDAGYGWDFIGSDSRAYDDNYHGTQLTSSLLAVSNVARILPLKVFNPWGVTSSAAIALRKDSFASSYLPFIYNERPLLKPAKQIE